MLTSSTATPKPGLRSLVPYLRPYRAYIAQGVALLLVTNLVDKTIPRFLRLAVDALGSGKFGDVMMNALWVMVLALCMTATRIPSRTRIFNVGRNLEYDLRNDVLRRLHILGPSFFQRMPTGETMSRAINDLAQVRAMIGFGFLNLVNSLVAYPLALFFMLAMSPELTAWALIPYPLLLLISRWASKAIYVRSRRQQEALGELSTRVQEMLSGIRVVRAFSNEAAQRTRFVEANNEALEANMRIGVMRSLIWPILMAVGALGTLLVLYRGSEMVANGELTVGELIAFLAYGESLRWPTMGLGYILSVVQRGRASYGRIREILDAEPDVVEVENAAAPQGHGDVSVVDLNYAYGETTVLDEVTFTVPAQSSIAIVGRTGSGKSTLASVLPRLLPSPPGHIFVDGRDVTEWPVRALRKAVGYAQQEPFLFSDTVMRNIGYSLHDPYAEGAMDKVRAAAREACILDEIDDLPAGFETLVGERGVQLSGGQKQRIALARALLNDPRVLVMDDPLSAVDAKTEARILGAIERAGQGKTLILITNRVAAAKRTQNIVVIDAGRIIEQGTHSELLTRNGLYASLARRQQLEAELSTL